MKSSLKVCAAALGGMLLYISNVAAQAVDSEAGLIGKRHAGPDFTYDHFSGSTVDKALGAAVAVNLPVSSAFDLGFRYHYSDASGPSYDAVDKALSASLLTHRLTEYGRAYFGGMLGHSWHRLDARDAGLRDNGPFWGVRAGYEIPCGRSTAVNLGLAYSDSFDSAIERNQALRYYAEANHWFSRDLAGVVSAAYRQIKEAPDAVSFTAGLRWAF